MATFSLLLGRGEPLVAISAEVTIAGWDVDSILKGLRLRSRRSYAMAPVHDLVEAGFDLIPTFNVPHHRVVPRRTLRSRPHCSSRRSAW